MNGKTSKKIKLLFIPLLMGAVFTTTPTVAQPTSAQGTPDSFADLAEKLLPSVVNISTTQIVKENPNQRINPFPQGNPFPPGSPFDQFFEEFFNNPNNPLLPMQPPTEEGQAPMEQGEPREYKKPNALGSGFVIDAEKGYIVTNNHVIMDADEIKVILHDDTTLDAKLIGRDDKTDLAVLQVETDIKLDAAAWGDSDQMRVGDWIVAIGNPFGLGGTVTTGIISARQRNINAGPYDDFLQTDASINRGNSGGPMFNLNGEVIGINTAIFSPSGGSVGIGFAIPSTLAQSVIKQLINYGHTRRGWLGVQIQMVTDDIAESLGMKKVQGALISNITKDSPAEKAGIKAGDVMLSFNGQAINEMRNLPRIVAETDIGKKAIAQIWRDGKTVEVELEVGEMEKAEALAVKEAEEKTAAVVATKEDVIKELGLSVSPATEAIKKQYVIADDVNGVVITKVKPDSAAAEKRLMPGDVITEFNQSEVKNAGEITNLIKEAKAQKKTSALLLINRSGNIRFVALKLPE